MTTRKIRKNIAYWGPHPMAKLLFLALMPPSLVHVSILNDPFARGKRFREILSTKAQRRLAADVLRATWKLAAV